MAKLTGHKIKEEMEAGNIIIHPFNEEYLGPNSYDLTLGSELRLYQNIPDYHGGVTPLDVKKETPTKVHEIYEKHGYVLYPNTLYLGHTVEVAGSKSYVPCIEGRSSMARLGILVHLTAGFGDVGFISQWTLEIVVFKPVRVYRDIRICQIYFDTLEGTIDRLYEGKYNNSVGAVASRAHRDREHRYVESEPFSMESIPADSNAVMQNITFGPVERYCSVCGDQQYHTPSGWTCQNGHGGVPEMNMNYLPLDMPLDMKRICVCGARFVAASDENRKCWKCGDTKNLRS